MALIHVQTLMILFILIDALCCMVLFRFWQQNRRQIPETGLWLQSYLLHLSGFFLIILRGFIFSFLSIVVANTFIIASPLLLLVGLGRYVGKKTSRTLNIPVLILCFLVHLWFTYIDPNIAVRNINISAGICFFCFQIAVLMFFRAEKKLRNVAFPVGLMGFFFVIANLARIVEDVRMPENQGFFDNGPTNAIVLVSNMLLIIGLTFALILMVSSSLLSDLEADNAERKRVTDELRRSEEKFSKVFQTSPNAIIISRRPDGKILDINDLFLRRLGYTREEVISSTTQSLNLWANELDRVAVMAALSSGEMISGREYDFRKKDGTILTGVFSSQSIELIDGPCILSTIQDVSLRKKIEEDLRQSRQFLSDLIEYSSILVCVKFVDGRYELVNKKWEEVTGLSRRFVLGKTDETLFPGVKGELFRANDLEVLKYDSVRETEETFTCEKGDCIVLSVKFPLHDESGAISGICGMMTEITERKHTEAIINHMATHDRLTDLPSLSLVKDRLSMAMASSRRYARQTAVLFIDLDGFKSINDTYGHDAGDSVLKEVASRLLACIRQTDTAARIGGDEFLVILTDLQTREEASSIAEKIVIQVSRPIQLDGNVVSLSASVGIALCPDHGDDPETLMKAADSAMYFVKKRGKNGFAFALFSPAVHAV